MSLLGLIDRAEEPQDEECGFDQVEKASATLVPPNIEAALGEIKNLDVTRMTPIEALNQIVKWQQSLM
jgi:hypothetical protein